MKIISKGDDKTDLHTVQHESAHLSQKPPQKQGFKNKTYFCDQQSSTGGQPRQLRSSQKAASVTVIPMTSQHAVLQRILHKHCGKIGHYARMGMQQRLQKVHEIVSSPEYQGQDIHLEDDNYLGSSYDIYAYE